MSTFALEAAKKFSEFEKELAALRTKHNVMESLTLPESYVKPQVFMYKLHGSVGSLIWRYKKYPSIASGNKQPDTTLVRKLLESYQPVPMIIIRSGCTSFQPEPETYESNGEVTEINGLIIKTNFREEHSIEWYAKVAGDLWQFEVHFPAHQSRNIHTTVHWSGISYEQARILKQDIRIDIPGAHYIRWASGDSRRTPSDYTIYSHRNESETWEQDLINNYETKEQPPENQE